MKYTLIALILLVSSGSCIGQKNAEQFKNKRLKNTYFSDFNFKNQLRKYNFSKLFMHTDNSMVYGFIGDHYQRIFIKFFSVTKDSLLANTYQIHGKSKVKNNIEDISGTISITTIRRQKQIDFGVKGEYIIIGNYTFSENKTKKHSGMFKGSFESDFYIDKNDNINYDDLDLDADGYSNNQFVGEWISYNNNIHKVCNWGDYRIPESGDLDIGAGKLSPNDKYLHFGWQSTRDVMIQSSPDYKKSKQIEQAKWWK